MTTTKVIKAKVFIIALILTTSICVFYISSTSFAFHIFSNGFCKKAEGNWIKTSYFDTEYCQEVDENLNKTLYFDEIYVINLEHRVERRERIEKVLNQLNLKYKFISAIDANSSEVDTYYQRI